MNVGKAAISLFLILLLAVSMLAIFSIVKNDKSTDSFYYNGTYMVNRSVNLTENIANTGIGMITPFTLITAILFFMAAILIFRRI